MCLSTNYGHPERVFFFENYPQFVILRYKAIFSTKKLQISYILQDFLFWIGIRFWAVGNLRSSHHLSIVRVLEKAHYEMCCFISNIKLCSISHLECLEKKQTQKLNTKKVLLNFKIYFLGLRGRSQTTYTRRDRQVVQKCPLFRK